MTDDFNEFFDDELAEAEPVPEPASDNVAGRMGVARLPSPPFRPTPIPPARSVSPRRFGWCSPSPASRWCSAW